MTTTTTARMLFATTVRQCRTTRTIGSLTSQRAPVYVCRSVMCFNATIETTSHNDVVPQRFFSISRRYFSSSNEEKNSKPVTTVDFELGNTDPEDDDENNKKSSQKEDEDIIDLSLFTEEVEVRMPDMGEGEGKVVKWYKKEGDIIRWQDTLCDIETPDFTFGMMTEDEGDAVLSKILVPEGSDPVPDGAVLCITLHKDEDVGGSKEE